MSLRKITKNRGSFPSDKAPLKLFYLALNNIRNKWTMPIGDMDSERTLNFEMKACCKPYKIDKNIHVAALWKVSFRSIVPIK